MSGQPMFTIRCIAFAKICEKSDTVRLSYVNVGLHRGPVFQK